MLASPLNDEIANATTVHSLPEVELNQVEGANIPTAGFSVASLGVMVVWLAAILALVNHYGSIGVGIGLVFASCTAYFLSRLTIRAVPLNTRAWNNLHLAVALFLSVIIGLMVYRCSNRPLEYSLYILPQTLLTSFVVCIMHVTGRARFVMAILFSITATALVSIGVVWSEAILSSTVSCVTILPLFALFTYWRERRQKHWEANLVGPIQCPTCGRSLSTESKICPRCDTRIT